MSPVFDLGVLRYLGRLLLAGGAVHEAVQLNGALESLDVDLVSLGHRVGDQGGLYTARGHRIVDLFTRALGRTRRGARDRGQTHDQHDSTHKAF
jgi:hypothetical protein